MNQIEVLFDPCHQVVLEGALDDLVKDIRGNDVVDICPREFRSEWLEDREVDAKSRSEMRIREQSTTEQEVCLLSRPQRCHIGPIACPSLLHVPVLL